MPRALPLLLLTLTGCFPVYRHTLAEVAAQPLEDDRGMLVVRTHDGGDITYRAPYAAELTSDGLQVTSKLLPPAEYAPTDVKEILTRRFNIHATIFAAGLTVTAAQLGMLVVAGVALASSPRGLGPSF